MDKLRQPPELQFVSSDGDLSERWKRWIQTVNLYMDVCMKDASEKERCSAFLYIIGQDGRDIHNTFDFETSEADKIKPNTKHKIGQTSSSIASRRRFNFRQMLMVAYANGSICKADEESRKQLKDLTKDDSFKVNSVKNRSRKGSNDSKPAKFKREKQKISSGEVIKCSKCGRDHPSKQCPAHGKVCHACRKLNHFAKCCRSRKVHGIDQTHTDPDILFVGTVDKKPEQSTKTELTKDECFITLEVNETPIKFKVDTGSKANIIPMSTYRELKEPKEPIQTSKTSLTSYTGDKLNVVGKCTLKSSQELDIIKVVMSTNKERDLKEKYSDVFKGLGCPKEPYHIELDPEVSPVVNAARKVPVAIKGRLKLELEEMEKQGVIRKVDRPTDWVNSIAIVEKPAHHLADIVSREFLSALNLRKKFSRRKFRSILMEGVATDIDDILIWGSDEQEHDARLEDTLQRCEEINLTLNVDKCKFKVKEVSYCGHNLTKVKPDESKIKAIQDMPTPSSKEIERLLGTVNYLAKFVPNLATITAPISKLVKKEIEFYWSHEQTKAFDEIKEILTRQSVLKFFYPTKPVIVRCDASRNGLGAVLIQEEQPIAYASRSMTEAETRYAQIEKELLSVLFALERFNAYTYGVKVLVENDHKPT
ncbi:Hypothetical predicted protein [Paramuricea clavata]|uniref:Uncharacterized protein n=1 Tax=Paramuricea clavata TaxID=317549 RepID=A0A7D9J871_PARCT|nr:Hypothetical predicted protein [Paramuricea clavata]